MMQIGKSRNVLASPLGEEGHEVAKGWTVVRMIMVFLFYVLSPPNVFAVHRFDQGGRRLAVRTAMEHPIGALPRTPFPASRDFPSRGNEGYGEKNRASYTSCTIPVFPLLWLAPPPFPRKWGHYGCLAMEPCLYRKA